MLTEANLKFCIKIIYFDKQTKQKKAWYLWYMVGRHLLSTDPHKYLQKDHH